MKLAKFAMKNITAMATLVISNALRKKIINHRYRKASDVATEILREVRQALLNMVLANSMGETYDLEKRLAEIEKKYESEGADDENCV